MKKRLVAILLVIVMVISILPMSALATTVNDENSELEQGSVDNAVLTDNFEEDNVTENTVGAVNPKQVNDAVTSIIAALGQMGQKPKDINAFANCLRQLGNASSIAGGIVSILQTTGIITDPYRDSLQAISLTLAEQNKTLNEISTKIDGIAATLQKMQAEKRLKERADQARVFTHYWDDYYKDFLLPMKAYMNNYESWIRDYTRNWSQGEIKRGDLYVYYTMKDNQKTQTYAKAGRLDLTQSDSGEVIKTEYTVCLPDSYVDAAMQGHRWKADDAPDVIINKLADAVIKAMNEGKLGCSQWFKEKWNAETDHTATAKEVAGGLYNNMIYIGSCSIVNNVKAGYRDQMRDMITLMNGSWKITLSPTGGLAAIIVPIQNTYNFEGDARKELLDSISGLSALLTQYSVFAMSVASQMDVLTTAQKNEVRQNWLDGITGTLKDGQYSGGIENIKKSTIKNKDNYCYITNTLIDIKNYIIESEADIKVHERRGFILYRSTLKGYNVTKWVWKPKSVGSENNSESSTNMVNIADYTALDVMYKTWLGTGKLGGGVYGYFLKNKVAKNERDLVWFHDNILTNYEIRSNYNKNDAVWMECLVYQPQCVDSEPTEFKKGQDYHIMDTQKWQKYTRDNDQVIGDVYVTSGSGTLKPKSQLATRAFYIEQCKKRFDELWVFSNSVYEQKIYKERDNRNRYHYTFNLEEKWGTVYGGGFCTLQVSPLNDAESGIIPEGQFDPDAIVSEMASGTTITIDTTYHAHENEKIIDFEDWKKLDNDYLYISTLDEKFDEAVEQSVEESLYMAKEEGKDITLSGSEKKALVNQVKAAYKAAEKETLSNQNMNVTAYLDPLGIYGNLEMTEKLAKAVLPDSQIATDGQTMEPVKNMITAAFYEPYVHLTWEQTEKGYEPKLKTTYYVSPKLLVWCDGANSYNMYDISDEAMQTLGLSMKVRLSTANAQNNESAKMTVYDDVDTMNTVHNLTATIQDHGSNAYVEFNVSKSGLFSVDYANKQAVNTGIDNQNMQVYFALIIMGIGIAILAVLYVNKRRKIKERYEM